MLNITVIDESNGDYSRIEMVSIVNVCFSGLETVFSVMNS